MYKKRKKQIQIYNKLSNNNPTTEPQLRTIINRCTKIIHSYDPKTNKDHVEPHSKWLAKQKTWLNKLLALKKNNNETSSNESDSDSDDLFEPFSEEKKPSDGSNCSML